ncbi:MAG: pyrroline-5-carboxylate reductase [Candidatus Geothermincolia bacterium]
MYRVGLIGAGNMGRAMLNAWIDSGILKPEDVCVIDRDLEKAVLARDEFKVEVGSGIGDVAMKSGIVVLAVKPQDSSDVLAEMNGKLSSSQVLLSIAAGLTIDSIRKQVGEGPSIVRVMPNMAALVRAAASAYAVAPGPEGLDPAGVRTLLGAIGEVVEVDEKWMNLVTALSGSGPAYFFYLTEALERAAVDLGMQEDIARVLARQTLWGAAKTIKETGTDPDELRRAVSSPGGTTLAALEEMDSSGFVEMISRAVDAATRRAGELAR